MTVAIFVANESDATCLIPWGVKFAQVDHTDLLIVCPRKSKGKRGWDPLLESEKDDNPLSRTVFGLLEKLDPESVVLKERIGEGTESSDLDRVAIETREIVAPSPEEAFAEEIGELEVWTLLLPAHEQTKKSNQSDMHWAQKLFLNAPCQVAIVRGLPDESDAALKILVASHGEASSDDRLAISRACQMAKNSEDGSVTLLYVRPDDDVVARQVGEKHVRQLARNAAEKKVTVEQRVELADSFCAGINRLPLDQFNLLLVGTRNQKTIRSLDRGIEPNDDESKIPVMTVRGAVPFSDRMWSRFKNAVRSRIPQLDRDHRVSLVDRLEESSTFNFDFVALISLSTFIAALGLADNSGAVVIGAMLVAPLMTPLVAMGFALVQGNEKLIRSALRSVVLGFAVALLIGAVVGLTLKLVAPHFLISDQMMDRGSPTLLDLLVALASGVAGAYAMGRPNLISAIPGVAIAAALVPPIATSGLALTMGDLTLSAGASLLFLTNIVAIVLGTAITFWAVGISMRVVGDRPVRVWPRLWFMGFVIISFLLATWMSIANPLDPRGDRFESNDTFETAHDLKTIENSIEEDLSIHAEPYIDFYRFKAAQDGEYRILVKFDRNLGDIRAYVFDDKFDLIASGDSVDTHEDIRLNAELDATYFLKVIGVVETPTVTKCSFQGQARSSNSDASRWIGFSPDGRCDYQFEGSQFAKAGFLGKLCSTFMILRDKGFLPVLFCESGPIGGCKTGDLSHHF